MSSGKKRSFCLGLNVLAQRAGYHVSMRYVTNPYSTVPTTIILRHCAEKKAIYSIFEYQYSIVLHVFVDQYGLYIRTAFAGSRERFWKLVAD